MYYRLLVRHIPEDNHISVPDHSNYTEIPLFMFADCNALKTTYPDDLCVFAVRKWLGLWNTSQPVIVDMENMTSSYKYIPTDEISKYIIFTLCHRIKKVFYQ